MQNKSKNSKFNITWKGRVISFLLGLFIFAGISSVFAEWPVPPASEIPGGWLGKFFDLPNSNENQLLVNSKKVQLPVDAVVVDNTDLTTKSYVDKRVEASGSASSDGAPIVIWAGESAFWVTSNGTACVRTDNNWKREPINNGQACGHGNQIGECLNGVCENIQRVSQYTLGSCNTSHICYDDVPAYCMELCGGTSRPTTRYTGDAQSSVCCKSGSSWSMRGMSAYNIRVGGIICDCPW